MSEQTPPMSLDDLKRLIVLTAKTIRATLGPRAAVIIAAGFPLDDNHDRFASYVTGPCLTSRGLLAWGQRAVGHQIDEMDTSVDESGQIKGAP